VEVEISGRHVEVTEAMEKHIRERIDKLPRFDDHIQHITVTLANESSGPHVEAVAKCHRSILVANAAGHEMYEAIDEVISKLARRVARLHDKLVNKHAREAHKACESDKEPDR
jgi:putative sigma-54 modulation protein